MRCYAMLSLHSFHLLLQSSNAKFPAGLAAPADLKRSRAWRYAGAEASQAEAELKIAWVPKSPAWERSFGTLYLQSPTCEEDCLLKATSFVFQKR